MRPPKRPASALGKATSGAVFPDSAELFTVRAELFPVEAEAERAAERGAEGTKPGGDQDLLQLKHGIESDHRGLRVAGTL